ncbi:hypothetical protein CHS0354_039383 [Potamilus streckersoni]|uniref:Uncharacterized protein n=1 Tax=Potamilus streckersoni TaxID=2493646 RepID=A0AAE0T405_9BIVA|nr:hypothetical protein CHS0354_039383 [Potamilus streckersoni]
MNESNARKQIIGQVEARTDGMVPKACSDTCFDKSTSLSEKVHVQRVLDYRVYNVYGQGLFDSNI